MDSCTHWLRPRNSPPPHAFGLIYESAVGQPRLTTSLGNPLILILYKNVNTVNIEDELITFAEKMAKVVLYNVHTIDEKRKRKEICSFTAFCLL